MNLRPILTAPPPAMHWTFRYGMLLLCLLLLAQNIKWYIDLPQDYPYERYGNTVVILMLLLNHLAFQFRWPDRIVIVLRTLATAWLILGCFYVFYWSHVLFP